MIHVKKVVFFDSYFFSKRVQFLESFFFLKMGSILCQKILFQKSSILWVILKKASILLIHIQLYESFFLQKKGSILWIILKKGSILRVIFQKVKGFNSWSHIFQKGSIHTLSHIYIFQKKNQLFESNFFKGSTSLSHVEKKGSILWVKSKKKKVHSIESDFWKGFNSLSQIKKKVQFFESYSHIQKKKKTKIQLLVTFKKNQFFSHIQKKVQFFDSSKKGWILWVMPRRLYSLTHTFFKKGSILRVVFFFFLKMGSILWVIYFVSKKEDQFYESYWKRDNYVTHISKKKKQFLWDIFKKGSILLIHIQLYESFFCKRRVQFFESYWKKVQFLESF